MDSIIFTDTSVIKIREVIAEEGDPSLMLRVFVQGGGCSGFQYGFTLDNEIADDDTLIEKDGIKFVVDPLSYQYLVGATIEYVENLNGAQFVINNPNAVSTCGCHQSFSV
jgi:iron-sulfur cluster insertion protein